jgi:hypothetical protein
MNQCENCGYEISQDTKHRADGDGHCLILDLETQRVRGAANRKYRDVYKRNSPSK